MERFRRLRSSRIMRDLVAETAVGRENLILPVFVTESNEREEIPSMPGVYRYPLRDLVEVCDRVANSRIAGVLLFGIPLKKDAVGSGAYDPRGIVQRAIGLMTDYRRRTGADFLIVADVCLCEYTDHGHCGVIEEGEVENDRSLLLHAQTAVSLARAGADIVAPSGMLDGLVETVRAALDEAGMKQIPIMAYSAKFASAFYGPFRDAAGSAPKFGDRRGYQADFRNGREALRELEADEEEGADILMVKPALCYLDIVKEARKNFRLPLAVYNVSGEYAMVKAAAERGFIDERAVVLEELIASRRAGADIIITYHALEAAAWLTERE